MKTSYLFTGGYNLGNDCGVSLFAWENEKLKELWRAADCPNPSYLAFHPGLPVVYAANEMPDRAEITAYRIDWKEKSLRKLNSRQGLGADLCHISPAPDGKGIYGASYTSGTLTAFALEEDGSLGGLLSQISHHGRGPHPRQAGPHAHQVLFDPSGTWLVAVDFGADAIFSYRVGENGAILENTCVKSALPAGEGPRHLTFSPDGREAWVITELGCKLLCCGYAKETGHFSLKSALPLLEEGEESPEITGGELLYVPDTGLLYASLRGADQICVVRREENGELGKTGKFSCFGSGPRMFSADKQGKYLFIGNQNSGSLCAVRLNRETGLAEELCDTQRVEGISFAQLY